MQRQQFTSSLMAVTAMVGAAVGLGNVWRFPYMMGSNGGSAFFLVYLLFIVLLAIPAMCGEWTLGRLARGGTISAFILGFGPRWGRLVGYTLTLGMLFIASYYLIVVANVGYTAWFSTFQGFGEHNTPVYLRGLSNNALQYGVSLLVLMSTLWITSKGLNKGIERLSNLVVPLFFGTLIYLIYTTLRLEGASEKMLIFLEPDFSRLSASSIFAALGQAAFSVGLGGMVMVVYGSYLQPGMPLLPGAWATAAADTGAALLASLFIFPTILVFGIAPEAGPTLLFQTLPQLFGQMDGGRLIGSCFLLALFPITVLTGVALLEVVIGSMSDDSVFNGLDRRRCIFIFGSAEVVLMLVPAFIPGAIGIMDLIFGSALLALGCALAMIALGWGLEKSELLAQFGNGITASPLIFWLRWVVPVAFFAILLAPLIT